MNRGDVVRFELRVSSARGGKAWLRTNLGYGTVRLREVVAHARTGAPVLFRDWHDLPMREVGEGAWAIELPLVEVGRFEAKAFFIAREGAQPEWPGGEDTVIKVEPEDTAFGNTIYGAFVRQFGPNKNAADRPDEHARMLATLDAEGYTVIPRSGTFRDLAAELDFIMGTLRFRNILLLPIHPTPTTYARMGRFGSPFASLDFTDVDPALAEFDKRTTPLEQFDELVDAVHSREGKILMDLPINHTGWASQLQNHHPEWFVRKADKTFRSPEAWGVVWADLSKLDYSSKGLWHHMAQVFLFWCRRGVDGFRCDAGYMIPHEVWEYIVAAVRQVYPETLFLLEGLGGSPAVTESLLAGANLDWAYSELFQNYDREQIEAYLPESIELSRTAGLMVNFAETHDNNRLASISPTWAAMRCALTALTSVRGGFGITAGVEWLCAEKIDVHEAGSLNWGSEQNLVRLISRLTELLEEHPAFGPDVPLSLVHAGRENSLALRRGAANDEDSVLVLANLDAEERSRVSWSASDWDPGGAVRDLVAREEVALGSRDGVLTKVLEPGEVLCLSREVEARREWAANGAGGDKARSARNRRRTELAAWALVQSHRGVGDVSGVDIGSLSKELAADPRWFCEALAAEAGRPDGAVTEWRWPGDTRRVVMIPPGGVLIVHCPRRFIAQLSEDGEITVRSRSLEGGPEGMFAVFGPFERTAEARTLTLHLEVFEPSGAVRFESEIVLLADLDDAIVPTRLGGRASVRGDGTVLCTNGRGAMAQLRRRFGELRSKYDAMLAANLHPDFPVDRRVLLLRCRAWSVHRDYSHVFGPDCQRELSMSDTGEISWSFGMPVGMGKLARVRVRFRMQDGENAVVVEFSRARSADEGDLADDQPVKIVVRPDLDDRSFHAVTKAYAGPESTWSQAVSAKERGFAFDAGNGHALFVDASAGRFVGEPEWIYMHDLPIEAQRGMDASTDIFSPGYFEASLAGGQSLVISARTSRESPVAAFGSPEDARPEGRSLKSALAAAMRHYVVKRDLFKTVIAGYPWFLDWGRDTLICLRGLISAGYIDESRDILLQMARMERDGTLPNMIRGDDCSNRDTSDAPLWFFVAVSDLLEALGSGELLDEDCGGRSLRRVLVSIASSYVKGTAGGVVMDPEAGLIYSPSHFTWMDTNHPAGTPRQGYPIEIQALWHFALRFAAEVDPSGEWDLRARRVRGSIERFYRMERGCLADCLHAPSFVPAADAVADDALRPNQLFAITLGAVEEERLTRGIIRACASLLVPGGIRTLADEPVEHPLPIERDGALLNDPHNPYWGIYEGDEDTRRKPAYHNGTAWTWVFPSYCEALFLSGGERARSTALALLGSGAGLVEAGCLGQVPEIIDGDAPHRQRGCPAQAWGVTEFYRVISMLERGW